MSLSTDLIGLALDVKTLSITQDEIVKRLYDFSERVKNLSQELKDNRWEVERLSYEETISHLKHMNEQLELEALTHEKEKHYQDIIRNQNYKIKYLEEKYDRLMEKLYGKPVVPMDIVGFKD